jgi:hypothetical protein
MATTIDSKALDGTLAGGGTGTIEKLKFSNDADIDAFGMPGASSADTFIMDFGGVVRRLTVEGKWVGTSTQIRAQIELIRALQDGLQNNMTFNSDFIQSGGDTDIDVMIEKLSIDWDIVGGMAKWVLNLVEGM